MRCPDDAGWGATPANAANVARVASLSGLSPAATKSAAAVTRPMPLSVSRVGFTARTMSCTGFNGGS